MNSKLSTLCRFSVASLLCSSVFLGCHQQKPAANVNAWNKSAPTEAPSISIADLGACVGKSQDTAFAFKARMWTGGEGITGECIKSDTHRPTRLLSSEEAAKYGFKSDESFHTIANVSHDNKFWIAQVPLKEVKDTYFQLEHFPTLGENQQKDLVAKVPERWKKFGDGFLNLVNDYLAGHTQLRVQFKVPVQLVNQVDQSKVTVNDLVFSVEAVAQEGYKYGLVEGLQDRFVAVYRVTSLEQKFYDMLVRAEGGVPKNHVVEQARLVFSSNEAKNQAVNQALVEEYITRSEENGYKIRMHDEGSIYNTIEHNCTNAIIWLIDAAASGQKAYNVIQKLGMWRTKWLEFFPAIVHEALHARSLIKKGTEIYPDGTMCDDPALADMKKKYNIGTCPTLATARPKILDLHY